MSLEQAKQLLINQEYTCVLTNGEQYYTSRRRGVAPLVELLEQGVQVGGFSAADKVVGRATAYLYVLLGIGELYARVISEPAMMVLKEYGISVNCESQVPNIINRRGDGICPFEEAVLTITDPGAAWTAIKEKMAQLHM